MHRSLRLTALAICFPLVLTGCGRAQPAPETGMEDDAATQAAMDAEGISEVEDTGGESIRITTDEGTIVAGVQELPDEWPEDVSVYPGASIQFGGRSDGEGFALSLTTADDKAAVLTHYRAALSRDGWKIETAMEAGDTAVLGATKDGRELGMQITAATGQTSIILAVSTAEGVE